MTQRMMTRTDLLTMTELETLVGPGLAHIVDLGRVAGLIISTYEKSSRDDIDH